MNIPLEIIGLVIGIAVTATGFFVKNIIKSMDVKIVNQEMNIKQLVNKKDAITDRMTIVETNYANIESSMHEFRTLLEHTQEMVTDVRQAVAVIQAHLNKK